MASASRGGFRTRRQWRGPMACAVRWPEFPDGNFIEAPSVPESRTMAKVAELGNRKHGMKFSRMRSSLGRNGLASSVNLLLPDAMATGKLQLVSNAVVREITTDKNTGMANGAYFVDRHSKREISVTPAAPWATICTTRSMECRWWRRSRKRAMATARRD